MILSRIKLFLDTKMQESWIYLQNLKCDQTNDNQTDKGWDWFLALHWVNPYGLPVVI